MTSNYSRVRLSLIALGALCVALVIAALISVALRPAAPLLAENTPEGAVQRYIMAIADADMDTAKNFVHNAADKQLCDPLSAELRDPEVSLIKTVITGNSAEVHVTFNDDTSAVYDSFFGMYAYQDSFQLTQVGSDWKILVAPWQVNMCTDEEMLGY
ncbi:MULTISPECIES: hypothetical protein [unclassified Arthrobacter]|uniref:hypothetical protein n=1 Tax=unclassified Arthrobacter TaxID=235627 RepID=UPI0011AFF71D|nr:MULTISPECIES: hypothetical protein [unclassified Arthrobacter]